METDERIAYEVEKSQKRSWERRRKAAMWANIRVAIPLIIGISVIMILWIF